MKNQKGITLIALIITIIVMLILVAVTVTVALNGGLFRTAKQATRDTEQEKEVEQRLADGKVKVGDNWYASYDNYLKGIVLNEGITLSTSTINLTKKQSEEVTGTEVLTGTVVATTFGMDEEPEITWEVSPKDQEAIKLSAETGKTITVEAKGTENATVTLTAKCTYEGQEHTATCTVTLKIVKAIAKGDFVEYGVAYKDVYNTTYNYSTINGWRLMDYTYNAETKTYSNVKLISTGIPAKLYYYYNDTTNNDWYVEEETAKNNAPSLSKFIEVLGGENYTLYPTLKTYYALQASAGLYYNFKDIKFAYAIENRDKNLGHFESITVYNEAEEGSITYDANKTDEKTGNDLFKAREDASVRILTLPEMNKLLGRTTGADENVDSTTTISYKEDGIGLFLLSRLRYVKGMNEYVYNSLYGDYWLASPNPNAYNGNHMCYIDGSGAKYQNNYGTHGVRPVICISSTIQLSDLNGDGALEMTVVQ